MTDKSAAASLEHRRKNFALKIEPSADIESGWAEPGTIVLHMTKHGTQWENVSLTPSERLKVVIALLQSMEGQDGA